MNYIAELNAFDNWIDTHPMSANAIGLWRALMQIANRAQWRESLAIPNALITLKSGLTTSSIKRAREELRQAGRITLDFRSGRQATIYHIIPFANQKAVQSGPQGSETGDFAVQNKPQNEPQKEVAVQKAVQSEPQENVAVHVAGHVAVQNGPQFGPIYKLNQTKTYNAAAAANTRAREKMDPERDSGFGETARLYQNNIHPFSGIIEADALADLYDHYGKEWVIEGIKTMAKSNGRSITYLERILERWERDGFKSQRKERETHDGTEGRGNDGGAGDGKVLPESIQAFADRKAKRFFAELDRLDRQEREKPVGKDSNTRGIDPPAAGTLPPLRRNALRAAD